MKKTVHLDSKCLSRVEYDTTERSLTLTFVNGRTYAYENVPEDIFEMLVSGDSVGRKFNKLIRDMYSYREL